MKICVSYYISLTFLMVSLSSFTQTYDITRYGASGDGKTLCTSAVQKAIDDCYKGGGGTVLVPAGVFRIGTLNLKSNVNLYIEAGAVLQGSPDLNDYIPVSSGHYGMFYTENAENITISGPGNIDGNGDVFFDLNRPKKIEWGGKQYTRQKEDFRKVEDGGVGDGPIYPNDRPYQMIIFRNCTRLTLKDVYISNSPFWTILFADCDGVLVDGIRLWTNMLAPNADGIDIASCNNVILSNSDLRCGDDAIAIVGYDHHFDLPGFSHLRHPSGNIIVNACNLQSYSSAVRIGSLDQNSVRNITVSDCNITNSSRGIGIFCRDEGSLENIKLSNLNIETYLRTGDWWGNGEPIHISAIRGKQDVKMGKISGVSIENVSCRSENGILIYGTDESIPENISFRNVEIEITDSKLNDLAGGNIDLRNTLDETMGLFERDIPGILAQKVNGLSLENVKLSWTNPRMPFFTSALEVIDFKDLRIRNFRGSASPINKTAPDIFLKNGTGADLDNLNGVSKENVKTETKTK
jgi:polygalacturonase